MNKRLRVGIIGAGADRRWASISHVPAVQALAGLELAAVVTKDQSSAKAAANAFGVEKFYGDAKDLFRDPDIDIVTVAVKVPAHRELVLGAIAAGKHVYCEWPLGRDVSEAEELRDATAAAGVHAAVGLQARMSPAITRARQLIAGGKIGRVLSARIYSGTVAFGVKVGAGDLYLEDAASGATLLTIHGGHALDTAVAVVGPLTSVAALTSIQYPEIEVGPEGRKQRRSIPDNLVALSRFEVGGVLSVEVAGARPADTTFRLEVDGESGSLVIDGAAPRGFQSGRLTLSVNGTSQVLEEGETASVSDPALNVAILYAAFRDDITSGNRTVPDFNHAVRLSRLIADVNRASETGTRNECDGWPRD